MAKIHIKKGDIVKIISGSAKGKQGKVLAVFPDALTAIVEGWNMVSKHTKPSNANPQGGILKKEAPIHISKLMLVNPKSGEASRIGRKKEENKLIRYSKKSGEAIK